MIDYSTVSFLYHTGRKLSKQSASTYRRLRQPIRAYLSCRVHDEPISDDVGAILWELIAQIVCGRTLFVGARFDHGSEIRSENKQKISSDVAANALFCGSD